MAAMMFCLVLSIGTVCYADEVAATVTVASAKIRASADPSRPQQGSAKQGGTVSIIGQTTGTDGKTWYQVFVDANTKGFIRADLVNVTEQELSVLFHLMHQHLQVQQQLLQPIRRSAHG